MSPRHPTCTLFPYTTLFRSETLEGTYSAKGSVSGKPGFPDHEKDVGGYENYPEIHRDQNWDSDDDGLPNWWEAIHGLDPNSDRKSTRLNSSHVSISYAVFCL